MLELIQKQELSVLHDSVEALMKSPAIRARVRRIYDQVQKENVHKMRSAITRWFTDIIDPELKRSYNKSLRSLQKDEATTISARILRNTNWKWIEEQGESILKPIHMTAVAGGGQAAYDLAGIGASFNVVKKEAIKAVDTINAALITEIIIKQKEAIKKLVKLAIKEGLSMTELAASLKNTTGLHWKWSNAVHRFEQKLLAAKIPVGVVKQKVKKYKNLLLQKRHIMIARTETAIAQAHGSLIGYGDIGAKRVRFYAAAGACVECAALDGRIYPISHAFGVIPVHPHGRCDWLAITPRRGYKHPSRGVVDRAFSGMKVTPLSTAERAAYQKCMLEYHKTGKEYCVALDSKGRTILEKLGTRTGITFTDEEMMLMDGIESFVHSHPRSGAFSALDFGFMAETRINRFAIISDGFSYEMRALEKGILPDPDELLKFAKKTYDDLLEKYEGIYTGFRNKGIAEDTANMLTHIQHTQEVSRKVAAKFSELGYKMKDLSGAGG